MIESSQSLWCLTQTKSINLCVITGNPFAAKASNYEDLAHDLQKNLAAVLINDTSIANNDGFLFKNKNAQKFQSLPYPNPIKYEQKEPKGDYLNSEVMRQGISLQMTDLKPNANIESEIFPKELTKEN